MLILVASTNPTDETAIWGILETPAKEPFDPDRILEVWAEEVGLSKDEETRRQQLRGLAAGRDFPEWFMNEILVKKYGFKLHEHETFNPAFIS